MNGGNSNWRAFSADVQMELRLQDRVLSIAQLGPDFLILEEPVEHPPAEAEIRVSIDGHERRWMVYLPDGLAVGAKETRIALGR
jgi:hypothetical protein